MPCSRMASVSPSLVLVSMGAFLFEVLRAADVVVRLAASLPRQRLVSGCRSSEFFRIDSTLL